MALTASSPELSARIVVPLPAAAYFAHYCYALVIPAPE